MDISKIFSPLKMRQFKKKGATLASLCPWEIMADDGIVLIKNGALSCAYEFIAPDIGSCSEYKINSIAQMFNNAIIQLGEGWAIQFELQRDLTDEYPASEHNNLASCIIEKQREINFSYQESHYENHYYLIFTYMLPKEITQKAGSWFVKSSKIYDGLNKGLVENEIKNFKMQTSKIASIISSKMYMEFLNSERLLTLLHSSVSMQWHKMKLPEEGKIFLDRIITDDTLENSMPLKLGEYYTPILAVSAFPSSTVPVMFDVLNKADCPLRWSTRFVTYSKEFALKKIDKQGKRFWGKRKSTGQWIMEAATSINTTREDSGALAQNNDADMAKIECQTGVHGFGDYCSNVMVWDKDLEVAEEKAKYIAGLIGSCGFSVKEETYNALHAFLSMQPSNVWANIRTFFVSTGNLSHVIPISSIWAGIKENNFMKDICGESAPHVVCSTDYGIPFFLNLNIRDVGHHWISGPTGAGKSTYLALLESQWLKYSEKHTKTKRHPKVIIFDKDRSARCSTICHGGIYIEPGKDKTTFQPLAEIDTPDGQRWAAEFIEILLTEQRVPITAGMRKSIFDAIRILATKNIETRLLTSFVQYCDYQNPQNHNNDIADGLQPYLIGGQYGELFDSGATNLNMSNNWTMFEMGTLMEMSQGAVAPTLSFLFRECEKKFDGSPVLLVMDEAWLFFKNPIFAAKITSWLKTLRKKNVFCVFATQEIDDAISSPVASTIISQCASKVFLADDEAETPRIKAAYENFGLDESEIRLLSTMRKKMDYFYTSTLGTRKFDLGLDKLQLAILTNSNEDHQLLDKIEKRFGKNTGKELVLEVLDAKGISYDHICRRNYE